MSQKFFLGCWLVAWPAIAMMTPFVLEQGSTGESAAVAEVAQDAESDPERIDPDLPSLPTFFEEEKASPAPVPATVRDAKPAATTESNSEQAAEPKLDPPSESTVVPPASRPVPSSTLPPSKPTFVEELDLEPLPPERNTLSRNQRTPVRSTNPAYKPRTVVSAQEELAQKLIHERAMQRAQQRHARLEAKQWQKLGKRPPATPHGRQGSPKPSEFLDSLDSASSD